MHVWGGGDLGQGDHVEDLGVDRIIISKGAFNKLDAEA